MLEYIKHSNSNREALTLHKCVNQGTSAQVTSSAGIFMRLFPVGNSSSKNAGLHIYNVRDRSRAP